MEVIILTFIGSIVGFLVAMLIYSQEWMKMENKICDLKQSNKFLKDVIAKMELEKRLTQVTLDKE